MSELTLALLPNDLESAPSTSRVFCKYDYSAMDCISNTVTTLYKCRCNTDLPPRPCLWELRVERDGGLLRLGDAQEVLAHERNEHRDLPGPVPDDRGETRGPAR